MRSRSALQASLLVASWIATQLLGPVSVIVFAGAHHQLRLGNEPGILVLSHGREPSVDHRHGALETLLALERESAPPHEDHVVRMPEPDRANRPSVATVGVNLVAVAPMPALVAPGEGFSRASARQARIAPVPLQRSTPLLL